MPDRTEQELLRRARGGDNAAFGHLQAGLERTVRRYVWRLIGQNDDEDEVVQDAFFALYMSLERITPPRICVPFCFVSSAIGAMTSYASRAASRRSRSMVS